MRYLYELKVNVNQTTGEITRVECISRSAVTPKYRIAVNNPVDGSVIEQLQQVMRIRQDDHIAKGLGMVVPDHPVNEEFDSAGLSAHFQAEQARLNPV